MSWTVQTDRGMFPLTELCTSVFFFSSDASLASSLSFSPGLRELSKQRQKPRSVNEPWLLALELWGFGLFLDEIEAGLESLLGSQRGEFPLLPPHNCDTACNSQGNDCGIQEIPEFLQGLGFFISNLMNPLLISVLSTKLVFSTQMAEQSLSSSLSAHVGQESFCFDTIPAPCTELARGHC